MLETMYPAAVNSKQTELAEAIDDAQTSFTVLDGSVLPPAPNLLTLGTDESAETVLYTGKTGNEITGITRGFESRAKSWAVGTKLARFFTAYDHDTFRENIEDVSRRVDNIVVPNASLTTKGITMLSKATNGNRDDVAATESAVAAAFQYGVERKSEVVAALNSIGVSASTSETWDQLIPKIAAVIRATGNATAAQVLAGSTFSNTTANGIAGTMVNRGAVSQNITSQNGSYTIPAGYHNGLGIIKAVFANLIAANIRSGVNIGGVVGTLNEGPMYATGTATSTTGAVTVILRDGSTNRTRYMIAVTGLTFKPNRITIRHADAAIGEYIQSFYTTNPREGTDYNFIYETNGTYDMGAIFRINEYASSTTATSAIWPNGFRLPVYYGNANYIWEAFRV
ncbi:tail fiber protein [Paenibacillus sp. BIC5C1]|uniref:tail fiber protein n=1 Tax=Paenibacillus sp. BIC5C1 TaxID=3078263 RepID=UPI0028E8037E|nr:tail fiber protein [Paenibacillus sp. BIC5C1]